MPDDQQPYRLPHAKFPIDQLFITPNALQRLGLEEPTNALARHVQGDWGEVNKEDRQANEDALRNGGRLFSVYRASDGRKFWVITEADRSVTTILLVEDY